MSYDLITQDTRDKGGFTGHRYNLFKDDDKGTQVAARVNYITKSITEKQKGSIHLKRFRWKIISVWLSMHFNDLLDKRTKGLSFTAILSLSPSLSFHLIRRTNKFVNCLGANTG